MIYIYSYLDLHMKQENRIHDIGYYEHGDHFLRYTAYIFILGMIETCREGLSSGSPAPRPALHGLVQEAGAAHGGAAAREAPAAAADAAGGGPAGAESGAPRGEAGSCGRRVI